MQERSRLSHCDTQATWTLGWPLQRLMDSTELMVSGRPSGEVMGGKKGPLASFLGSCSRRGQTTHFETLTPWAAAPP